MQKEIVQSYRLSPQQERLWLLEQKHPGRYTVQCSWLLEGPLDEAKLRAALNALVERHEILRTSFQSLPDVLLPVQVIAEADSSLDYELEELEPNRHVLNLNLPALCADATSLRNLLTEFCRAYEGQEFGDEPMQYADYAAWRHELLDSEETKTGREFWRQLDLPALNTQRLPLEQRFVGEEYKPRVLSVSVEPERLARIEARAREYDCDVSTFLLACYQVLLARLSGQNHIVVGMLCDGRKYDELQSAVGLLAGHLPISTQIDNDKTFTALLAQLKPAIEAARAWEEYFTWDQVFAHEGDAG